MAETVLQTPTLDLRQQLQLEQKRLAKLWDAFKKQEDEYRAVEKERDQLWARIQDLEKAMTALGPNPERVITRLGHMDKENERLRRDVAELGARLEEYREGFHQEQARLAKLFKVYEDSENQIESLRKELEQTRKAAAAQALPIAERRKRFAKEMLKAKKRAAKQKGGTGPVEKRAAGRRLKKKYGLA